MFHQELTPTYFNQFGKYYFPVHVGIVIKSVAENKLVGELLLGSHFLAPNGYLHAGAIVTLADTIAGYSTIAHLPENAKSFTTLELKSNFTWAVRDGI